MASYHERASRIVARVMPIRPAGHGFYDPAGFVASCRYSSERNRLYWRTFARLRAKVEGGRPHLNVPAGMEGTALYAVARELEALA
jgi:hypothetical protein